MRTALNYKEFIQMFALGGADARLFRHTKPRVHVDSCIVKIAAYHVRRVWGLILAFQICCSFIPNVNPEYVRDGFNGTGPLRRSR